MERATLHLDAAYICLLRLAPEEYLRSIIPNILMECRQSLKSNDPRLTRLSTLTAEAEERDLMPYEAASIIAALQGAHSEAHLGQQRVRSFRNVIVGVTAIIAFFVIVLAIVGLKYPELMPLCFIRENAVACPTIERGLLAETEDFFIVTRRAAQPLDTIVVEFVGLLAATVAAAAALRRIRGTADPYSLPVALATLKLPTGALTAFLGLTMLRAGVIPGFVTLDTSAQILAYAVLFGYSQELFTGLVDRQAQSVLASSADAASDSDIAIRTARGQERRRLG